MEDGIEQNIKLSETTQKIIKNNFIYLFMKDNSDWEDYIIITNKNKAIEYSKIKNCRIEIFSKNEEENYKPTFSYYKNGEYFMNS